MAQRATINPVDDAGYYLITGFGLLKALRGMDGVSPDKAGAWVHADFLEEAGERLLAAGYEIVDRTLAVVGRTAPPKGGATDKKPERPPWCGQCDEYSRHIDIGDVDAGIAKVQRCPRCHPLAGRQAIDDYSEPIGPLGEWSELDQFRSHRGWAAATRALGNSPEVIEQRWPETRERPKVFRRG